MRPLHLYKPVSVFSSVRCSVCHASQNNHFFLSIGAKSIISNKILIIVITTIIIIIISIVIIIIIVMWYINVTRLVFIIISMTIVDFVVLVFWGGRLRKKEKQGQKVLSICAIFFSQSSTLNLSFNLLFTNFFHNFSFTIFHLFFIIFFQTVALALIALLPACVIFSTSTCTCTLSFLTHLPVATPL